MAQINLLPPKAETSAHRHPIAQGIIAPPTAASQNWLALSGQGLLDDWEDAGAPLMQGCFVAELQLPLPRGKVLLYHHSKAPIETSFSLFAAPNGEISIFQRQGQSVLRAGGVAVDLEQVQTLRLSYRFDAALRRWHLHLLPGGSRLAGATISGHGALPFTPRDMQLIAAQAERDPSVIWHGFCRSDDLPNWSAWIGARTPIDTPQGSVAAAHLRAGDVIITQAGPQQLRAVRRHNLPARGAFAPVVLRGPHFDLGCDVLVSAQQPIAISGYMVEYLFGRETVRVVARDVVDGHTALAGVARDVVSAVHLEIAAPALIGAAGDSRNDAGPCRMSLILGRAAQVDQLGLPQLTSFETAALLRQMGRLVSKVA